MILCLCRGVSDRTVRLVVAQGASTVDEVTRACGAGEACGTCVEDIERLVGDAVGACPGSGGRVCLQRTLPLPSAANAEGRT